MIRATRLLPRLGQQSDQLFEHQAGQINIIDGDDLVSRRKPRLCGRRTLQSLQHHDASRQHINDTAETLLLAVLHLLQLLELLRREKGRVWIERP